LPPGLVVFSIEPVSIEPVSIEPILEPILEEVIEPVIVFVIVEPILEHVLEKLRSPVDEERIEIIVEKERIEPVERLETTSDGVTVTRHGVHVFDVADLFLDILMF
jgi:endonuclease V-like protein UPF0215 family